MWAATLILVFGDKRYVTTIRHAKESLLRADRKMMRFAIEDYTIDKLRPPKSLEAQVDEGYLRLIHPKPDWLPHYTDFELDE